MLEHKTIKWILKILALAIVVYIIMLLMNEDNHHLIQPKQEYISATIDTTIPVHQVEMPPIVVEKDTFHVVNMPNVVAVRDSDSITHYNLYRELQEIVTIDMEEHTEKVYFTWEDIKAYYQTTFEFVKKRLNKNQNNDSN